MVWFFWWNIWRLLIRALNYLHGWFYNLAHSQVFLLPVQDIKQVIFLRRRYGEKWKTGSVSG